jgi:aminomethyltransferase
MEDSPKRTPLYEWHMTHGATMMEFSGWSMPLWYPAGAVKEHRSVITQAGIFDTSHMSVVSVSGKGAFDLLQLCFTRDLLGCFGKDDQRLTFGKSVFGVVLNHNGELVDDAVLFQIESQNYIVIVNASMGATIAEHLRSHANRNNVAITDMTGQVCKIDLQGPLSAKILMGVIQDAERVLLDMQYFTFKGHYDRESPMATVLLNNGTPVLLSRTGFTGEFGFELLVDPENLVSTWEKILSYGEPMGLIPCGLSARDSLRVGGMLPLSHQDIGPWPFINNPWTFALPFNPDRTGFTKSFVGDVVLSLQPTADHTHAFVGPDPRKVSPHENAVVLDDNSIGIGTVLTCVSDMAIGMHENRIYSIGSSNKPEGFKPKGLSCGYVKVKNQLTLGQQVMLKDNRRSINATIVDDIRPDRTARRPMHEMV